MTPVTILRAQTRPVRTWRNGGGATRDVAVFPEGAQDNDFLWRASVATIAAPGPFSAWPGVDRALLPLRGRLALAIEGLSEQFIGAGDGAVLFAGEAAVVGRPLGGECTVLNIMTRRGEAHVRPERWPTARSSAAGHLLLLAEGGTSVRVGDIVADLEADDALLFDGGIPAGDWTIDREIIAAEIFRGPADYIRRPSPFSNSSRTGRVNNT